MTLTDHRTDFGHVPDGPDPADMNPDELAAAGLRWATKAEHMAQCQMLSNYADPGSADSTLPAALPMARMSLESAIATLDGLQHELRTRRRRIVTPDGQVHAAESPYFTDGQGRGEDHWRAEAAQVKVELARLVKAGPPRDEVELQARCHLRLQEASALNTAEMISHNSVLLRQAVADARNMVQLRQAEFEDLSRRARPYMDSGQ